METRARLQAGSACPATTATKNETGEGNNNGLPGVESAMTLLILSCIII